MVAKIDAKHLYVLMSKENSTIYEQFLNFKSSFFIKVLGLPHLLSIMKGVGRVKSCAVIVFVCEPGNFFL